MKTVRSNPATEAQRNSNIVMRQLHLTRVLAQLEEHRKKGDDVVLAKGNEIHVIDKEYADAN